MYNGCPSNHKRMDMDIYLNGDVIDPQGLPLILLNFNGRKAVFAKQLASIFEGSQTSSELLRRLRDAGGYEQGEGWERLSYDEIRKVQTWEKTMVGQSSIESLLEPLSPNGTSIIYEEGALWLLARSNTPKGKEFGKLLVRTFIAVRDGQYIAADSEDVKRLEEKADYTRATVRLRDTIYQKGLHQIGRFNWEGDKAFYGGKGTKTVRRMKGIPEGRPLADFDGSLELRAKTFAKDLTDEAIKHKELDTVEEMTKEYKDKNKQMRKALTDVGIYPERTPRAEDIKKVEKRAKQQLKDAPGLKKLT